MMQNGMSLEEAHDSVLQVYPVGSNYAPEVIKEYHLYFSDAYFEYWGISR